MKASLQSCKGFQELVEDVSRETYKTGKESNTIQLLISSFERDEKATSLPWWIDNYGRPACLGGTVGVVDRMLVVSLAVSVYRLERMFSA